MTLQETALNYLTFFCQANIEGLSDLLDEHFRFEGPSVAFDSKNTYIQSLHDNPPTDCQIEIIKVFEEGDTVCVFYTFRKPNVQTPMAQYFKFNGDKICETLLIFDSAAFA